MTSEHSGTRHTLCSHWSRQKWICLVFQNKDCKANCCKTGDAFRENTDIDYSKLLLVRLMLETRLKLKGLTHMFIHSSIHYAFSIIYLSIHVFISPSMNLPMHLLPIYPCIHPYSYTFVHLYFLSSTATSLQPNTPISRKGFHHFTFIKWKILSVYSDNYEFYIDTPAN